MAPGTRAAEHGGEEQALVDFEPALVALEQAVFGRDILRRGNEARHDVGGGQARRRESVGYVDLGVHGTDSSQSANRVKALAVAIAQAPDATALGCGSALSRGRTSLYAAFSKYLRRFARTRVSGGTERSGSANSRPVTFS